MKWEKQYFHSLGTSDKGACCVCAFFYYSISSVTLIADFHMCVVYGSLRLIYYLMYVHVIDTDAFS